MKIKGNNKKIDDNFCYFLNILAKPQISLFILALPKTKEKASASFLVDPLTAHGLNETNGYRPVSFHDRFTERVPRLRH